MSNLQSASYEAQCRAAANYLGRIDRERPPGLSPESIAAHFSCPVSEVIEHIEAVGKQRELV
jgi:hypothetical protein